jgi:hypothetical protein
LSGKRTLSLLMTSAILSLGEGAWAEDPTLSPDVPVVIVVRVGQGKTKSAREVRFVTNLRWCWTPAARW